MRPRSGQLLTMTLTTPTLTISAGSSTRWPAGQASQTTIARHSLRSSDATRRTTRGVPGDGRTAEAMQCTTCRWRRTPDAEAHLPGLPARAPGQASSRPTPRVPPARRLVAGRRRSTLACACEGPRFQLAPWRPVAHRTLRRARQRPRTSFLEPSCVVLVPHLIGFSSSPARDVEAVAEAKGAAADARRRRGCEGSADEAAAMKAQAQAAAEATARSRWAVGAAGRHRRHRLRQGRGGERRQRSSGVTAGQSIREVGEGRGERPASVSTPMRSSSSSSFRNGSVHPCRRPDRWVSKGGIGAREASPPAQRGSPCPRWTKLATQWSRSPYRRSLVFYPAAGRTDALPAGPEPRGRRDLRAEVGRLRTIVFATGTPSAGSRNERPMTRYFPSCWNCSGRPSPTAAVDGESPPARRARLRRLAEPDSPRGRHGWLPRRPGPVRRLRSSPSVTRTGSSSRNGAGRRASRAQPPSTSHPRPGIAPRPWFRRFEAGLTGDGRHLAPLPDKREMRSQAQRTADCVVAGFRHFWRRGRGLPPGLHDEACALARSAWASRRGPRQLEQELQPPAPTRWPTTSEARATEARQASQRMPGPQPLEQQKDLSWEPLRIERVEASYDHPRVLCATHFLRWRRPDSGLLHLWALEAVVPAELAQLFGTAHPAA